MCGTNHKLATLTKHNLAAAANSFLRNAISIDEASTATVPAVNHVNGRFGRGSVGLAATDWREKAAWRMR